MLDVTEHNEMTVDEKNKAESKNPSTRAGDPKPRRPGPILLIVLLVIAAVLGIVIYRGIAARTHATAALVHQTNEDAVPTVVVTYPKAGAPAQEIVLPGNTQAFTDTPIYARTNGYLKRWYFDIGARVKAGQLLAEIETPEVDQQLAQARADLATAEANLALAKSTADRWKSLLTSDSVSKQETDEKVGDYNAKKATVDAMQSNVKRLEQLSGFGKVYAPFSGVITARNVDIGTLIDAGANTPGHELFHMAAIRTLRVYVNVPQLYSRAAKPGASANLTLDEFPGRVFHGRLVRNASAIDSSTHTLLVEVDVDNPTGELLPGAYVLVHLKLPTQISSVTIPSNTLLFRSEGLRVAVVRDNRAVMVPIKIGRDYGDTVEVVSGLQPNEAVIVNPADSLLSGTPVHVRRQDSGAAPSE
ncbi:MAG TPA: efflux RND transporter periplasmic adaptor subunit [Bryobacteraceae bacterium]|nr:efflux RND transporter periplasmic adaptor subunit [Bryobacteraceae bacterium]